MLVLRSLAAAAARKRVRPWALRRVAAPVCASSCLLAPSAATFGRQSALLLRAGRLSRLRPSQWRADRPGGCRGGARGETCSARRPARRLSVVPDRCGRDRCRAAVAPRSRPFAERGEGSAVFSGENAAALAQAVRVSGRRGCRRFAGHLPDEVCPPCSPYLLSTSGLRRRKGGGRALGRRAATLEGAYRDERRLVSGGGSSWPPRRRAGLGGHLSGRERPRFGSGAGAVPGTGRSVIIRRLRG